MPTVPRHQHGCLCNLKCTPCSNICTQIVIICAGLICVTLKSTSVTWARAATPVTTLTLPQIAQMFTVVCSLHVAVLTSTVCARLLFEHQPHCTQLNSCCGCTAQLLLSSDAASSRQRGPHVQIASLPKHTTSISSAAYHAHVMQCLQLLHASHGTQSFAVLVIASTQNRTGSRAESNTYLRLVI